MSRLTDRVAVVTGAAAGIGLAIARRFAVEGARLFIVDRAGDRLRFAEREISESQADVAALSLDLTEQDAPNRVVDGCLKRFGRLDILVNNAGIGGSQPVGELAEEDWRRMIDTNLTAVFRLSKRALSALSRDGAGRIINISSVFGLVGFRGSSSYAAAKAGVIALTRSMAVDYAKDRITVNAIAPGLILTEMSQRNLDTKPWFRQVMYDATPLRRMGQPDDIAGAALFLASDDASFVTGHVLAVDGGWSVARYQGDAVE
jgi:meso-butanediol dehydrogenase / (S,S)-butanediol dehydrogenase / diacetyl reductase